MGTSKMQKQKCSIRGKYLKLLELKVELHRIFHFKNMKQEGESFFLFRIKSDLLYCEVTTPLRTE